MLKKTKIVCTLGPSKIVAIIIAVAAAVVGVAFAVKKIIDKKKAVADEPENYVSCSCCDTCAPAAN